MANIDCLICYDAIDGNERYGYPECIDEHTFCKDCIVEMLKTDGRCPIDKRENNKIIMRKNDEEFLLDEYYQRFIADDGGAPMDQRITENRTTGEYPLNICLWCKKAVSDDTEMFWWSRCPEHHRVCVYCMLVIIDPDPDIYPNKCLIKHNVCEHYYNYGDYYCSRLSDAGNKILLTNSCTKTFLYLKKKMNASRIDREDGTPNEARTDSAERIEGVLTIMRTTGKYPRNTCVQCVSIIPGPSYGFVDCNTGHTFCEECVTQTLQMNKYCTVCYRQHVRIRIEDGRVTSEMNAAKLLIRAYIRKMEVRNERAQEILASMESSPNCEANIPPELCIGCFTVIRGRRHSLCNNGDYIANYCKRCIIEIGNKERASIYLNPKLFYFTAKKGVRRTVFIHFYNIIDFINSNGRTKNNIRNIKSDLRKYFENIMGEFNCLKCGEAATEEWREADCCCNKLCCESCLKDTNWETVCPFRAQSKEID